MYSLKEILSQAVGTTRVVKINNAPPFSYNVIKMGVKIQKFPTRIEILNCSKGGSYYKECNDEEYSFFTEYGWDIGCVKLAIHNCIHKLRLIENKIKTEVNTRKNDKHIQNLKNKREFVLCKHAELQLKLKSILN